MKLVFLLFYNGDIIPGSKFVVVVVVVVVVVDRITSVCQYYCTTTLT